MNVDVGPLGPWLDEWPLAMWAYDPDTLGFVAVNAAAVSLYGWSPEEFLSMKISDLQAPAAPVAHETLRGSEYNPLSGGMERHRTKSRATMVVRVWARSSAFANPPAIAVAVVDVTSLARAHARANAMVALGQLADNAPIDEFLRTGAGLLAGVVESTSAGIYLVEGEDGPIELLCVNDQPRDVRQFFSGDLITEDVDRILRPAILQHQPIIFNNRSLIPRSVTSVQPDVERVLVVPVVRGGRVIAIAAASNKISDYVADDAESVSIVADLLLHVAQRDKARTATLAATNRTHQTLWALVESLSKVAELRDSYTAGHQRRVANLAAAIGHELQLSADTLDGLFVVGSLHDIGKVAIPTEILVKPYPLSVHELGLVRTHCQVGADVLSGVTFPWPVAEAVRQHHERLDGSGYPNRLKGDEILLEARIVAVADVVEAMVSHRPYRGARSMQEALQEIRAGSGKKFDPTVVAACERVIEQHDGTLPTRAYEPELF